jgi:hypothetical protein
VSKREQEQLQPLPTTPARTRARMVLRLEGQCLPTMDSISRSRSSREPRRTRWLLLLVDHRSRRHPLPHKPPSERTFPSSLPRHWLLFSEPRRPVEAATSWRTFNPPSRELLPVLTRPRRKRTRRLRLSSRPRVQMRPSITRLCPSTIIPRRPGGRRRTRSRWCSCKNCLELLSPTRVSHVDQAEVMRCVTCF